MRGPGTALNIHAFIWEIHTTPLQGYLPGSTSDSTPARESSHKVGIKRAGKGVGHQAKIYSTPIPNGWTTNREHIRKVRTHCMYATT